MKINKIIYGCIMPLWFISCGNEANIWQQNRNISQAIWNKDDVLKFEMPVSDTSDLYAICLNIRNRTDYDYQNLYLFIKTLSPEGKMTVDTLNYFLAYDSGEWTGSGGFFSKFRENVFLYRKYIKFTEQGDYEISIRHGMRNENLDGIASISLLLQNSNNIKLP